MGIKTAVAIILISILVAVALTYNNLTPPNEVSQTLQTTATPPPNPYNNTFEGFRLSWVETREIDSIRLYSNLTDKKTSTQVYEEGNCKYVISAGFYNKNNEHIGLFTTNGNRISESIQDDFFDGYFYIKNSSATISLANPDNPHIAVQSGPLLMQNNRFLIKKYQSDNYSRRILVGTSRQGSVVFISIYGDNKITGPKLGDIQKIILDFEKRSSVDLVDLLNLDGGSHSAFITDSIKVSEISTIGGYFCLSK